MRGLRGYVVPAVAMAGCASFSATGTDVSGREAAILAVTEEIWAGWETGDRGRVEPHLATDFVDTGFRGIRRSRQDVLAFLPPRKEPRTGMKVVATDHRFVHLSDDVSVLTYRTEDCRTHAHGEYCIRLSVTDTFVRARGWQLAAAHFVMLPANGDDEKSRSEQEILLAEAAADAAQVRSDVAAFGRVVSKDWTLTLGDGRVVSRIKFLADMEDFWHADKIVRDLVVRNIRLTTDGATVTGIVSYEWRGASGEKKTAKERYTDVYERSHGVWRKVRSHVSCLSGLCLGHRPG